MNPRTLKALKGGIKKWERIVKSTKAMDRGAKNCPLCSLFSCKWDCGYCPVKKRTGKGGCDGTPYQEWLKHHREDIGFNHFRHPGCPDCLRLAKEEVKFLKGLLPKKEREAV